MNNYSPFRSIMKGAGFVFAGNFILYAIGFVYHISIVRILGPEKFGIWQIVYTIVTMAGPLSLLGLGTGIIFYCSHVNATKKHEDIVKILISSLKILFVSTVIVTLVIQIFNFGFIERYYPYEGIKQILFIFAFVIPFFALERIGESVFRAIGNARMPYQIKIFQELIKVCLIPAALWFTHSDLRVMSLLILLSYVAATLYLGVLVNRYITPFKKIFKWDSGDYVKKILSYSWPLMINDYVQIFASKIDVFFIGYFISASAVGVYAPTITLSNLLWIVPHAITYLLFPVLNKLNSEGNREDFINVSERVYKYMIYLNLPALCFVVVFSKDILNLLYGIEFAKGYMVLMILSISMVLQIFLQISWYILGVNKKTKLIMVINIIYMLCNVIANYLMVPMYGITGAALATLGSSLLIGIWVAIVAAKFYGKFIFPIKTMGILVLSLIVLIIVFLVKDRSLVYNLLIFFPYFILTIIYGVFFEKEEIIKGISLVKKRLSA